MSTATERLYSMIEDFSNAMLITQGDKGLNARPMAIASIDAEHDTIWFATDMETEKVDEIMNNPEVNVAFQGKLNFASVRGSAKINRDQQKINQLWNESWKTWFPEGKTDSNITLIEVNAKGGEFWDMSGTNGLSMLIDTARAYIKGETPERDSSRHDTVEL